MRFAIHLIEAVAYSKGRRFLATDSTDGTRLVSGSGDFTVRVWDTLSPQKRREAAR